MQVSMLESQLGTKACLFRDFHAIMDETKRNTYLLSLVQLSAICRRRHETYEAPERSRRRREATICYTVPDGKGNVIRCVVRYFQIYLHFLVGKSKSWQSEKKQAKTCFQVKGPKETGQESSMRLAFRMSHIITFPREGNPGKSLQQRKIKKRIC